MLSVQNPIFRGIALLVITTVIWGTTFPIIKLIQVEPNVLVAARFIGAAIVFLPWLLHNQAWRNMALWRDALPLALLFYGSYITQANGLQIISSNRSAFITGLNVICVPLIASLFGQRLSWSVMLAAVLAVLGIGLMSFEGNAAFGLGELWTFACAILYALYILRMEGVAKKHAALPLSAAQLLVVAVLSGLLAAPKLGASWPALLAAWPAILYLALLATALTTFTQVLGQRFVPATQTAIIYALEPVFAAIFAFFLLREVLGWRGLAGGFLILLAMLIATLPSFNSGST